MSNYRHAHDFSDGSRMIFICHGTSCMSAKSVEIRKALEEGIAKNKIQKISVDFTGCHGFCEQGPIVFIEPEGTFYTHVQLEDVPDLIDSLKTGKPVERLFYTEPSGKKVPCYRDIDFYKKQTRIILRNCGMINPERIEDYIAVGGYASLKKALTQMTPEQVIEEVKQSGLRGRGGAGFPTGLKWELCRKSKSDEHYVICNADEGDPGAFMNRSTMEGDPHCVIEGMTIAAYAMGGTSGYIYIRAEYPVAVDRVYLALKQAREKGYLGKNIMGTNFSFDIHVKKGAGAFVCGEETALMRSIEGHRGEPRPRPPFPAQAGLWGKPSNINNVETFANIPQIIEHGGKWLASMGSEKSKGTKVFSLVGKTNRPGLVEIPMGTKVSEIIYDIGGGIPNKRTFKAVQTGGPSGGCIPAQNLDADVDYESLKALGSIVGSGGMVVMDEDTCMVDVARYFLSFTAEESCGQCTPCRVGTRKMLEILDRICTGHGKESDIATLESLAVQIKDGSLCGLGQTAPNPVLTTLKYFRHEYEEHIKYKKCYASVCASLFKAPCQNTCPADTNVPGYIQLIKEGRFGEAYELNREDNPFPSICGRICEHPCEARCRRQQFDESISIRELKRYCSDQVFDGKAKKRPAITKLPSVGKKVAIVGGGPSGLSAAYFLARLGYSPEIFEASDKLGGMLRYGIPKYRLPHEYLDQEINDILALGVKVNFNTKIGDNLKLSELVNRYDAIYLAVGAQKDKKLGLEGDNLPGILPGLKMLRDINRGAKVEVGKNVIVIGGGNVAVDTARSALRLGADKVMLCYRRDEEEMPAYMEEIKECKNEGIELVFLVSPEKVIVENGRAIGIMFRKMKMGKYDKWGRRTTSPTDEVVEIRADSIIVAIGQGVDADAVKDVSSELVSKNQTLVASKYTMATKHPKIFAGGDAATGPASAIEAIGQGKQAAGSIDKYLSGENRLKALKEKNPIKYSMTPPTDNEMKLDRKHPREIDVCDRSCNFSEVVCGLDDKGAKEEAKRCFRCDISEGDEQ